MTSEDIISGVEHINLNEISDSRGTILELFRSSKENSKLENELVISQMTIVRSESNVLRGIHLSDPKFSQIKLVHCMTGEIIDYLVDLRKSSKTYLKSMKVKLTEKSPSVLTIPHGIGHAYITLDSSATLLYGFSSEFDPNTQISIQPLDPTINLDYPKRKWKISQKDQQSNFLEEINKKGIEWL